jgi:hypothetical protein
MQSGRIINDLESNLHGGAKENYDHPVRIANLQAETVLTWSSTLDSDIQPRATLKTLWASQVQCYLLVSASLMLHAAEL